MSFLRRPVLGSFKLVRRSKDGRWAVMPVVDWSRGLLDAWIVEIATDLARPVAALDATRGLPVFSPDAGGIGCSRKHRPISAASR